MWAKNAFDCELEVFHVFEDAAAVERMGFAA